MDARAHERKRTPLHALVMQGMRQPRQHSKLSQLARPVMIVLVAVCLLSGITGGLLRAGVRLPALDHSAWAAQATGLHAALMICGFLGTVIGIERAVALRAAWAFMAPLASIAGAVSILNSQPMWGAWLFAAASVVFVVVNVKIVSRQTAPHTWLLLLSAVVWLAGNLHFMRHGLDNATLAPWFGFLVLTITAERLEMSRLMRNRPGAQAMLIGVVGMLLAGVLLSLWQPVHGGVLYGAGLFLLALWLGAFDIARHTVRAQALTRYMAICLLSGYAWLAVAGLCWAAYAVGWPCRDAALHALGLGFIVSMVMGHAPVILPAVAGIKLHFDHRFYLPLLALHGSLLVRLLPGGFDPAWRAMGSGLNALAIVLFAATVVSAAWSWRQRHPAIPRRAPR